MKTTHLIGTSMVPARKIFLVQCKCKDTIRKGKEGKGTRNKTIC